MQPHELPRSGSGTELTEQRRELGVATRTAFKWSLFGQLLARAGSFALGLVLARILVPAEYGEYSVALGFFTILLTIDDLGLRQGLVRWPRSFMEAAPTALTIGGLSGLSTYALAYLAAPYVARLASVPDATSLIRVLCVGLVIDAGFHIVATAGLHRNFDQSKVTASALLSLVSDGLLTIILANMGFGAWSLVLGALVGQAVQAVATILFFRMPLRLGFDPDVARNLLKVSAPFAAASLVGAMLLNIDYLIVGNALGPAAVGLYLIAFNVANWPIPLLGTAVRSVAIPAFSRLRDGGSSVDAAFERAITLLNLAAIPFIAVLVVVPRPVIETLYGPKWGDGARALPLLAVAAGVRLISSVVDDVLFALGRSGLILFKNLTWLSALVPALAIGARTGGLRGVGAAQASVALGIAVVLLVTLRVSGVRAFEAKTLRLVAVPAIAAFGAAAVAGFALRAQPNATQVIGVVCSVGFAYLLVLGSARHRYRALL